MKDNRIIGLIVVIAIVVGIFYLLPMLKPSGCKFDSDCQEGYVCNTEGKCVLPEIVNERTRDNFCADNEYPDGMYDPDCPSYCPASFERTGSMTMCCYEDSGEYEMAISVDCDTDVPLNLFPEVTFGIPEQRPSQAWYDQVQAIISFVPETSAQNFKYVDKDVGITTSITTGATPTGASGYLVWLDSITVKSKTSGVTETVFQSAWNNCKITGGIIPCVGKAASIQIPSTQNTWPSAWGIKVPKESVNSVIVGNYIMDLKYCGTLYPETLQIPVECYSLKYNIDVGESVLSFSVSAGISY